MSGNRTGDDCYYFYNTGCSKGIECSFRHEPAALETGKICHFWKNGGCSRPRCNFRHMELEEDGQQGGGKPKWTSPKQCFWNSQPSGCQKYPCPFLHTKDSPVAATTLVSGGSIIVNRNKLEALRNILPVKAAQLSEIGARNMPRRMIVPPGAGNIARQAVTGGIKNRLGKPGDIKNRLGSRQEIRETLLQEKDDDDLVIEELQLRESAIKSIDLRKRLHVKVDSEVKPNKLKKKKKKTDGKSEKTKENSTKHKRNIEKLRGSDLPSASDYSDLDTPHGSPDPQMITVMSKTTGMYADTNISNKSAKIRLGKRKAESTSPSPVRGSMQIRSHYRRSPSLQPAISPNLVNVNSSLSPSPSPPKIVSSSPPPSSSRRRPRRSPSTGSEADNVEANSKVHKKRKKDKAKKSKKSKKDDRVEKKKKAKKLGKSKKKKGIRDEGQLPPATEDALLRDAEKEAEDDEEEDILKQMDDFIKN